MFFMISHEIKLFLLGACVGWLAWGSGESVAQLAWIVMLPMAWRAAGSRWAAAALMAGYYLAGARGLVLGTGIFFGNDAGVAWGLIFWGVACLFLAAPFGLFWSANARVKPWVFLAAVAVSVMPPLAIIGWLNPLVVAGAFFPGLGWLGLWFMAGLFFALVAGSRRGIVVFCAMAFTSNVLTVLIDRNVSPAWIGVDTSFPELSSGGGGDAGRLLASMERVQWIKKFAKSVPDGQVWVLPETVAGVFDVLAEYDLEKTEDDLRARGARLVVGAELPQVDGRYKNAMVVLGTGEAKETKEDRFIVQNIPVPIAMWKPWAGGGAVGDFFGQENFGTVGGLRVAAVICYEQLLMYSWLRTMWGTKPDVLIAVSNMWWARDTSLPGILLQKTRAFGRLFDVSVVVSRNG